MGGGLENILWQDIVIIPLFGISIKDGFDTFLVNISVAAYLVANESIVYDNPVAPTDGYFLLNQMYQGSNVRVTLTMTKWSIADISGKGSNVTIHMSYLMYKPKQ